MTLADCLTFGLFAATTCSIMGAACWASNVWPGNASLAHAAAARLCWWAAPMALIVWFNGAPVGNAMIMGAAAWLGAWIPHVEVPDVTAHWKTMLGDMLVLLSRAAAVLAPPAAVFWLCGAFWEAMLVAVAFAFGCIYLALLLPHRWPGLRDAQQVAGVLFGLSTGFWLAVAVWTPSPGPDLIP